MVRRAIFWAVRSYIGGPARSWVFTSAAMLLFRLVQRSTGRRELIDISPIKPGQTVLIEHLPISHKRQLKDFRREKRAARRSRRNASTG